MEKDKLSKSTQKKIFINFFISIFVSMLIGITYNFLPKEVINEYSINLKLKTQVGILFNLQKKQGDNLSSILVIDSNDDVENLIIESNELTKNCALIIQNNRSEIYADLKPYTISIKMLVGKNFDEKNCPQSIEKIFNQMFENFYLTKLNYEKNFIDQVSVEIEMLRNEVLKIDDLLSRLATEKEKIEALNVRFSALLNINDSEFKISRTKAEIRLLKKLLNIKDFFHSTDLLKSKNQISLVDSILYSFICIFIILNFPVIFRILKDK